MLRFVASFRWAAHWAAIKAGLSTVCGNSHSGPDDMVLNLTKRKPDSGDWSLFTPHGQQTDQACSTAAGAGTGCHNSLIASS